MFPDRCDSKAPLFCVSLISNSRSWINDGSRLGSDGSDFFTSYDEVFESFDAMGLQENLLRGIYAYGMSRTHILTTIYSFGK